MDTGNSVAVLSPDGHNESLQKKLDGMRLDKMMSSKETDIYKLGAMFTEAFIHLSLSHLDLSKTELAALDNAELEGLDKLYLEPLARRKRIYWISYFCSVPIIGWIQGVVCAFDLRNRSTSDARTLDYLYARKKLKALLGDNWFPAGKISEAAKSSLKGADHE